jgi:hypothetical protein
VVGIKTFWISRTISYSISARKAGLGTLRVKGYCVIEHGGTPHFTTHDSVEFLVSISDQLRLNYRAVQKRADFHFPSFQVQ